MKLNLWLALPAALTALAVSQPAAAAVVAYTYAGTVDFGVDDAGLFGGGALTSRDFTAVFYRDDALALPENVFVGEINSFVTGEGAFSPVWAQLTIDGVTIDIGGVSGEQSQYDDGQSEGFAHTAIGALGSLSFRGNNVGTFAPTLGDVLPGPDYHGLVSLPSLDGLNFDLAGRFDYVRPSDDDNAPKVATFANFRATRLGVSPDPNGGPTAPAPEPSAWALMILGFGCAGAMLRRRVAFA